MRLTPPHCWFQFHLSTWFVLVGIQAWAMIEWPWVIERLGPAREMSDREIRAVAAPMSANERSAYLRLMATQLHFGPVYTHDPIEEVNPALRYPALALIAFVGCKTAWAIGRRVAERQLRAVVELSTVDERRGHHIS